MRGRGFARNVIMPINEREGGLGPDLSKIPESLTFYPGMEWEHLVSAPLKKIPKKVWRKMTPAQREWWKKQKSDYAEELANEKIRVRLKKHGY